MLEHGQGRALEVGGCERDAVADAVEVHAVDGEAEEADEGEGVVPVEQGAGDAEGGGGHGPEEGSPCCYVVGLDDERSSLDEIRVVDLRSIRCTCTHART